MSITAPTAPIKKAPGIRRAACCGNCVHWAPLYIYAGEGDCKRYPDDFREDEELNLSTNVCNDLTMKE